MSSSKRQRLRDNTDVDDESLDSSGSALSIPAFDKLPEQFRAFLTENKIPPDAYNLPKLYRFLRCACWNILSLLRDILADRTERRICRVNPRKPITAARLHSELVQAGHDPTTILEKIEWIEEPGTTFYRLPASTPIFSLPSYNEAHIYGIDLSSACVVLALDPQPEDHVADICCAPGAKTSFIADLMVSRGAQRDGKDPSSYALCGSVTAVDISRDRLGATRTLCAKYEVPRVRLFVHDGCTFDVLAPASTVPDPSMRPSPTFLPALPAELLEEAPVAKHSPTTESVGKAPRKKNRTFDLPDLLYSQDWRIRAASDQLYDRVMVDAQCTLDASVRHLLNYNKVGWLGFDGNVNSAVVNLQKQLIYNGFRMLKPGGYLVYSTCSFCEKQNEDVVRWLLQKFSGVAELTPISFGPHGPKISEGTEPLTVRFYPSQSGTSGMFIAKILKKKV
jgi:16S rRNA C967 or C1407 C5-methylase (RsmB/RsmF family)